MVSNERLTQQLSTTGFFKAGRDAEHVAAVLNSALGDCEGREREAQRAVSEAQRKLSMRQEETRGVLRLIQLADGTAVSNATSQRLVDQLAQSTVTPCPVKHPRCAGGHKGEPCPAEQEDKIDPAGIGSGGLPQLFDRPYN